MSDNENENKSEDENEASPRVPNFKPASRSVAINRQTYFSNMEN